MGNSLGPAAGSVILRIFKVSKPSSVPTLFYIALAANMFNLLYVCLILPECVSNEDRESARRHRQTKANRRKEMAAREMDTSESILHRLARNTKRQLKDAAAPLAPLVPRRVNFLNTEEAERAQNPMLKVPIWKRDIDLTLIGLAFWCNYLNMVRTPSNSLFWVSYRIECNRASIRTNICMPNTFLVGGQNKLVQN